MKKILAILSIIAVLAAWPLLAAAGPGPDPERSSQGDSQGIELPDVPHQLDDLECDQQDTSGDPHNLGGGFRGTGSPTGCPPLPIWVGPFYVLIINMV